MLLLNDDLSDFARAIVCGEEPSSRINTSYQNYSVAIAIEVYRNNYCGNLYDTVITLGKALLRSVTSAGIFGVSD